MTRTVEHATYRKLRRQLISGAWEPGRKLKALAIARKMGVSPTPVMQAIRRLATEGFVEVVPHMGAFVRRPSLRELAELFDLRRWLEVAAVRDATRRASETQLAELERLIGAWERSIEQREAGAQPGEALIVTAIESDLFFHMLILEIAGNRRAARVFRECHLLTRVFGAQTFTTDLNLLGEEREDLSDHRRILAAMRNRKPAEAARWLNRHLRRGKRSLIASVKQSRASRATQSDPPPWSRAVGAALARAESYSFGH